MLSFRETSAEEVYELFKVDPRTEQIVEQARLNGPVGNISFGSGALWAGRATPTVCVIRIDPFTLHARVFATNLETAQP
jgi:hypothetical protein